MTASVFDQGGWVALVCLIVFAAVTLVYVLAAYWAWSDDSALVADAERLGDRRRERGP